MTKTLQSLAFMFLVGVSATAFQARAYTLDDPYGASYNSGDCSSDHCGGDAYDNAGINVGFANHVLNVSIFTNFHEPNTGEPSIGYGDLFLTVDGVKFVLDTSSALGTGTGNAFGITSSTTIKTAGQTTPLAGRPAQQVLYESGGIPIGTFNLTVGAASPVLNVLTYSILDSEIGFGGGAHTLDLLWAMSCANDVVGGTVTVGELVRTVDTLVPLPGTLFLVAAGAFGMASVRRRRD